MIKRIADFLEVTDWDWLAVSIALFSFCVAVKSFVIAKRTLASQKQTEKNTMPIINITIQEFLFGQLIIKLLDAYVKLTALWNVVADKDFLYYPSEHILTKLKIDNSVIHLELFYNQPESYKYIDGFREMINEYNINLEVLNQHLKCENIENDMISNEIHSIISANNRIAEKWEKIMSIIFEYKLPQISKIIEPLIEQYNIKPSEELKLKYYNAEDEVYLTLVESDTLKKSMLFFLDNETNEHIKEFSHFLIKKY